MSSDPFDDILNLEEEFFAEGYRQGTADGIIAGKIEGRSVGLAKGYEKFLESGRVHGRAVVWANRLSLPQKTGALPAAATIPSSSGQQGQQGLTKMCSLPPLAPNARLEKNVTAAFALVEPDTLSKENNDDAVNDFDDRFKRAQGKVKIIERMAGEGAGVKDAAEGSKTEAKEI
ncbi:putative ORAOV1 family protein [Colletotrichum spinosum]|uniref:Putative ORAOV1 family protein n=1 Tax=Colletotrichum spinosum TaxID=1347390 RepID=A0A4V3HRX7_9PEZI|nr:putative ORAOV1 family protein [Colletotrichum spinosum]